MERLLKAVSLLYLDWCPSFVLLTDSWTLLSYLFSNISLQVLGKGLCASKHPRQTQNPSVIQAAQQPKLYHKAKLADVSLLIHRLPWHIRMCNSLVPLASTLCSSFTEKAWIICFLHSINQRTRNCKWSVITCLNITWSTLMKHKPVKSH